MQIGIIGLGSVGRGLGTLFHRAGYDVVAGVRDPAHHSDDGMACASIAETAGAADLIVLAVPYVAIESLADELREGTAGKPVVDATNPLGDNWAPLDLGSEGSAGEVIQRLLPEARVVKAFNTVFADNFTPERLAFDGRRISTFLASDHAEASRMVAHVARDAGFDPVSVGGLNQCRSLEAIAHLNIQLAVAMGNGTNSGFLYVQRD